MKLFALVTLTMFAFAGNSVLNKWGVGMLGMDPFDFAVIRVAAGAILLSALVWSNGQTLTLSRKRLSGAVALAAYMFGFSWAYVTLDAGLGALILFAVVQVTMFGFALTRRQIIPPLRWIGGAMAITGLVVLLWPSQQVSVSPLGAGSMIVAGVAWAIYTLLGQGETDAVTASAGNFLLCLPIVAVSLLWGSTGVFTPNGILAAVVSGAITSGLGYALWYRLMPQLPTTVAAIAQLSVPVIAVAAGVLLLGEDMSVKLVLAGALVLGGIAISLVTSTSKPAPKGHK